MTRRTTLVFLGSMLAASVGPTAQAQVSIDMAKVTCEQFILDEIFLPKYIAMWLNGYYNGKRDNTVIDPQALEKNEDTVRDYCYAHRSTPIMQAAEAVLNLKR
jgi:acid stress chaperone HdeB